MFLILPWRCSVTMKQGWNWRRCKLCSVTPVIDLQNIAVSLGIFMNEASNFATGTKFKTALIEHVIGTCWSNISDIIMMTPSSRKHHMKNFVNLKFMSHDCWYHAKNSKHSKFYWIQPPGFRISGYFRLRNFYWAFLPKKITRHFDRVFWSIFLIWVYAQV